jgi:hypothetical protein
MMLSAMDEADDDSGTLSSSRSGRWLEDRAPHGEDKDDALMAGGVARVEGGAQRQRGLIARAERVELRGGEDKWLLPQR